CTLLRSSSFDASRYCRSGRTYRWKNTPAAASCQATVPSGRSITRNNPPGRKRAARLSSAPAAMGTAPCFSAVLVATAEDIFPAPNSQKTPAMAGAIWSCCCGQLQHLVHCCKQMSWTEGLADHSQNAAFLRIVRLQVIPACCQHDRGDLAGGLVLLQALTQL